MSSPREIEIGGKKFPLSESETKNQELYKLKQIVDKEGTHAQWSKQLVNIALLVLLILMNLCLGSSSTKSIIGVKSCSRGYWAIYASFIFICACATVYAIRIAKREQNLKVQYGNVNIVESDLLLTRKSLASLCFLGFFGGLVAGAFGLGGGVIFNPVLLALGLPPLVSSASGLYLVTFSKVATSVVYIVYGQLDFSYGLWLSFCASLGSVAAVYIARWYEKRSGR